MQKRRERLSELVDRVLRMPYEEKKRRAEEAIKAFAERRKRSDD